MRILLVDDHENLGSVVLQALERSRFVADWVRDVAEAEAALRVRAYDLVLLDLNLPDGDGLDLLRQIQAAPIRLPVIVLTARGSLNDRIAGLEDGADDYLIKPFELVELIARVRAVLRRPDAGATEQLYFGRIALHPQSGAIAIGDQPVVLARRESQLLAALLRRSGRVCSRDHLEGCLYSQDSEVSPNAIESSVSRLRTYLAEHEAGVEIRAIRGVGYVLAETIKRDNVIVG